MSRIWIILLVVTLAPTSQSQAESDWPGFRGTGNSVANAKDLPLQWEMRTPCRQLERPTAGIRTVESRRVG